MHLLNKPPRGTKLDGRRYTRNHRSPINIRNHNLLLRPKPGSGRNRRSRYSGCTPLVMFALSSCYGRRDSGSDDQFATLVAKMPESEPSTLDISMFWRRVTNITHELHPGEMHCNMGKGSAQSLLLVTSDSQIESCTRKSSRRACCTLA